MPRRCIYIEYLASGDDMTPEARWERADDKAQARELEAERLQFEIWGEAREVGLGDNEEYYLEFCPSPRTVEALRALKALGATY